MMKEIYARGPIACSAATDHPFMYNYTENEGVLKEGVYITDTKYTTDMIDHVMEVAGWGLSSEGTKYWVVRNSWGTYWGDMGWVKIRRGVMQHVIESRCDWAVPDFGELEMQLQSRVLGDYIKGTSNVGPRVGIVMGSSTASALSPTTLTSTGNVSSSAWFAIAGASVGSVVTGLVILVAQALHRRNMPVVAQPSLLG